MAKDNKKKISALLDHLQYESWQLEMLFSGLSIALLVGAWEPLERLTDSAAYNSNVSSFSQMFETMLEILQISLFFILINLFFHLFLRGLWIATIGLRSVSSDIDFEKLNFSTKFESFLKKRIGDFDHYIEKIEKLCSIIFAFTFLLVFCLFSFIITSFVLTYFFEWLEKISSETVATIIGVLVYISGFLYFIDFVTLGAIKRIKKYFNWYFPIYIFFSFLTLSFLYRPIYYNLIDNKFGKRFAILIIPYLMFIPLVASINFGNHKFFPNTKDGSFLMSEGDYLDQRKEEDKGIFRSPKIASKFIKNSFLEVFIPYTPIFDDEALELICPNFDSGKYLGLGADIVLTVGPLSLGGNKDMAVRPDSSMLCLKQLYAVYINDSLVNNVEYQFKKDPYSNTRGLTTILDIEEEKRGKHFIRIEKQKIEVDSLETLIWEKMKTIVFWKE